MSIYDKASLVLIPSGTKTSKVYSQVPTNGDGDFTFSRSTAATRVNASGNIEKETQNLLLQSNNFDTTWTNSSSTETGGQSDKDGGTDAWLISATAQYGRIVQSVSVSGVNTISVYAKEGTTDAIFIRANGGTNPRAFFNLDDGTLGSIAGNVIDSSIEDVGSGWYRCSMSFNESVIEIRIYPAENGNVFPTSGNIYIQDAQLEQGLVARDYIETTTTAVEGGITDNVPRLDYTDSSCPALLLEPQRTNLFRNSEYFGYWGNYGGSSLTITPNYSDSPEGVSNSYRLQKNAFAYARLDRTLSGVSSGTLTYSLFVKGDDVIKLRVDAPSETPEAFIDCSDGTITNHSNTPWDSISSVDYGNGWYRFICTHTFTNTPTIARIYPMDAVNGANNTNAADVQVYGAQLEAGSYATSYIPTYGSAVTRNAETNVRIESVSDLIGQTEGTLFFEGTAVPNTEIISIHRSTLGSIFILSGGSGLVQFYAWYGNGVTINQYSNVDAGSNFKAAFAYKNGNSALYCNGQQIALKTEVFDPQTTLSSIWIAQGNYAGSKNKVNTKQALVFPTRLSNEELATLTTI